MKKKSYKIYKSMLNKVYTLQFINSAKTFLPRGQIEYHIKNYQKYFKLNKKAFSRKKILETGAGPGVHAAILSLTGANVCAADILDTNIKKIKNLKKIYKLNNLKIVKHDFMKSFPGLKDFDLVACHNWIQHTPNPQKVFINLSSKMLPGSRFYLSCYLSGTFRFFITQIAREIIKDQDFNLIVKKTKKYFSDGFKIFKNPDNISARHITDDFLSPYVIPTTYKNILSLAKQCGLEPIVRGPKIKNLSFQDSIPLRLGFIKKEKKILKKKIKNYFVTPVDEFKENKNKYAQKASKLALNLIKKKSKLDKNQRVDICLKLFQIRAEYCNQKIKDKYIDLIVYLQKINKKI